MTKQPVRLSKLDPEERRAADYGFEDLVAEQLKAASSAAFSASARVDRNNDNIVDISEFSNALWKYQLLRDTLVYYLDGEFWTRHNKMLKTFNTVTTKIKKQKPFTDEEIKSVGLEVNGPYKKVNNYTAINRWMILKLHRALMIVISKLKRLNSEGGKTDGTTDIS